MDYKPEQGDIIQINFTPHSGHEQSGKRPALVVSGNAFHRRTNLAIVCPITKKDNGFPMHISLRGSKNIDGFIMCEHVKSLDIISRDAVFIERIPVDILNEVLHIISLSLK